MPSSLPVLCIALSLLYMAKAMVKPLMSVKGGSVVALVTPMTASNDVDLPKFTKLLEWHLAQGTDGAVILGTTGGNLSSMSMYMYVCMHICIA
jgi:hypothetical protein